MSGFNLSALAVRERSVTLFLLVAISIAGVIAFLVLGRAEDPSFTIKQMTVVTVWPGATAKEMEELVAVGGTVITLLFLPALYAIWFRIQPAAKGGQAAATIRTEPVPAWPQ